MTTLNLGIDIAGFNLDHVSLVLSVRDGDSGKVSSASTLHMTLGELDAFVRALGADKSGIDLSTVQRNGIEVDPSQVNDDRTFDGEKSGGRRDAEIIGHSEAVRKRQSAG